MLVASGMTFWPKVYPVACTASRGSCRRTACAPGLIADHGITCSMSRSGNVWDNVAMESFFSSLKTERIARKVYRTRDGARADVFDYIELSSTTFGGDTRHWAI